MGHSRSRVWLGEYPEVTPDSKWGKQPLTVKKIHLHYNSSFFDAMSGDRQRGERGSREGRGTPLNTKRAKELSNCWPHHSSFIHRRRATAPTRVHEREIYSYIYMRYIRENYRTFSTTALLHWSLEREREREREPHLVRHGTAPAAVLCLYPSYIMSYLTSLVSATVCFSTHCI